MSPAVRIADSPSSVTLTMPATTASTRSRAWVCAATTVPAGQAYVDTWYPQDSTLCRNAASVTGPSRRGSHRSIRMMVSMKSPPCLLRGQVLQPLGGPVALRRGAGRRGAGPRGPRRLHEQPERVFRGSAGRLVVRADAEDGGQDVRLRQRRGKIRPVARLAVHLEIHEAIQRNRGAVQALHGDSVFADVARYHGGELGVAARVLPDDLAGDGQATTLGRPLVAPRLLATLHETKALFHLDSPPGD